MISKDFSEEFSSERTKSNYRRKEFIISRELLNEIFERVKEELNRIFEVEKKLPNIKIYCKNIKDSLGFFYPYRKEIVIHKGIIGCYYPNQKIPVCIKHYLDYGNALAHELMHYIVFYTTSRYFRYFEVKEKTNYFDRHLKIYWIREFLPSLVGFLYEFSKNEVLKKLLSSPEMRDNIKKYIINKIAKEIKGLRLRHAENLSCEDKNISTILDILENSKGNIEYNTILLINYKNLELLSDIGFCDAKSFFYNYFMEECSHIEEKLNELWKLAKEFYKDVLKIRNGNILDRVFNKWYKKLSFTRLYYKTSY